VTNEDQIAALFAKANPVPSLDLLDPVEGLDMEHLAHLSARSSEMTNVKTDQMKPEGRGRWPRLAVAVAIAVIAVVAIGILVNNDSEVAAPTTTESAPTTTIAAPTALADALNLFQAGTYTATPFAEDATICQPSQSGCIDPVGAESITFSFTLPDNRLWSKQGEGIWYRQNSPPGGASMVFNLGGWVYSDPCTNGETSADVPVGLTVDEFANALADHPLLEVTTPVDVTLAGYSGKYLDLQVPADITECAAYRAWEFWLYAQGPGHRWHLWILDVDGVRVVVETMDYEGTTEEVQAALDAIVNSIQIEP
jgi:hypothetical protein